MEKTIPELIQELDDDDEFVREEAFGFLEIRAEESFEHLMDVLSSKGVNKNIKKSSAKLLGIIGNEKAMLLTLDNELAARVFVDPFPAQAN